MLKNIVIVALVAMLSGAAAIEVDLERSGRVLDGAISIPTNKGAGKANDAATVPGTTAELPSAATDNAQVPGRRLAGTISIPTGKGAGKANDAATVPGTTPDLPSAATDNAQVPGRRMLTIDA